VWVMTERKLKQPLGSFMRVKSHLHTANRGGRTRKYSLGLPGVFYLGWPLWRGGAGSDRKGAHAPLT
jgi:hypothetical protein